MNFCVDCKYCLKIGRCGVPDDYYCRKPCDVRYNYITGDAITHIFSDCVDIRKNNPDCPYFEQKSPKWYKTLFKKLITKLDTGTKLES